MRPLPRLLAFTDDRIAGLDDLGVRAAAIAAAGPAVGLVARLPGGSTDQLAALALRMVALARPPEAIVLVTGRVDVALATGARGVILRAGDLAVRHARDIVARSGEAPGRNSANLFVLRSVHSAAEADAAVREGADALIVGPIWATPTHPGLPAAGTALLEKVVTFGVPAFAIGGVSVDRAREAASAGAWGVAVIRALWDSPQPYRDAMAMLAAFE